MNDIKRNIINKRIPTTFLYKYGIYCKEEISKKIIFFYKKNKRIILRDDILYKSLTYRFSEETISILTPEFQKRNSLHAALLYGNKKSIIQILINKESLIMRDEYDETPLHTAIIKRYPEDVIRILVTEQIKDCYNKEGNSPLHLALIKNCPEEIIKLLISKYNLSIVNFQCKTPLNIAESKNYPDYILKLLTRSNKIPSNIYPT